MVKKSTGQENINQIGLSKLFNFNEEKISAEHKKTGFWNFTGNNKQIIGLNSKKTRIREEIQKAKAEETIYKQIMTDDPVRRLDFQA